MFSVDTSMNRLGVPAGQPGVMQYDANGNLTYDTYSGAGSRIYDAENRLVSATNNSSQQSSYTYDADGMRVRRNSYGQETWQIYSLSGGLMAEYAAGAPISAPQKEYGYRNGQLLVTAAGAPAAGTNLASGKPTTQSTTVAGAVSSRAVDGNLSGNWTDNSVTHTDYQTQAWWQVDLGSVQPIGTINVWNRTDCCGYRLSNFYVLVSDTPFQSTDLTTMLNQPGVSGYYTAGQAGSPTSISINRTGKYVRVQLADTEYLSLTEVQVFGASGGNAQVHWMVSDQLGTPRMVADKTGSLAGITRHDYLPFGEEMFASSGGRTTQQGYSLADGDRQQFTGKERDNETRLDYFGARYYASTQGRFTSPDPIRSSGQPNEPQSWNRYAYTLNNPVRFTDPTGMWTYSDELGSNATDKQLREKAKTPEEMAKVEEIIRKRNIFRQALEAAKKAYNDPNLSSAERAALQRAVAAYGEEYKDTDVEIREGYAGTDGKDPYGPIKVYLTLTQEWLQSDMLTLDVAHEGVHVADWKDYNLQFFNGDISGGPTWFQTETDAYKVSSYIAKSLGHSDWHYNGTPMWNPQWDRLPPDDREAARNMAVERIVNWAQNKSGLTPTLRTDKRG